MLCLSFRQTYRRQSPEQVHVPALLLGYALSEDLRDTRAVVTVGAPQLLPVSLCAV